MANKDTMILNDSTVIELETGTLGVLQVLAADKAAMVATWDKLTPGNLSVVRVKSGDGLVRGNYTDLVLVSETSVAQPDGSILTTYNIREKDAIEKRLDALESGQNVQNGAIVELAGMVGGEA